LVVESLASSRRLVDVVVVAAAAVQLSGAAGRLDVIIHFIHVVHLVHIVDFSVVRQHVSDVVRHSGCAVAVADTHTPKCVCHAVLYLLVHDTFIPTL